jgi:acyl carrier protein
VGGPQPFAPAWHATYRISSVGVTSIEVDETTFIERSRAFLAERLDMSVDDISPDTDLIATGLVDSLRLLEYFDFIEELRGERIPAAVVSFELLSTMRGAYRLLVA